MVQLWLTLIGLFLMLLLGLAVFFYSIKLSVNSEDSNSIDPLPEGTDQNKH